MLCHTVPSSGSFNGGLSTGLSGAYSATPSLMTSSSNNSTPATTTGDYRAPPDMSSYLPPYASYLPPRDDLFYGGLRNSMQQSAAAAAAAAAAASSAASTTHYRPEENSLGLIPPRTSYHERCVLPIYLYMNSQRLTLHSFLAFLVRFLHLDHRHHCRKSI